MYTWLYTHIYMYVNMYIDIYTKHISLLVSLTSWIKFLHWYCETRHPHRIHPCYFAVYLDVRDVYIYIYIYIHIYI
jgi:hypothetical protein